MKAEVPTRTQARPNRVSRAHAPIAALLSLPLVVLSLAAHARFAKNADHTTGHAAAKLAIVRRLPTADFAFASGSRHLRFVSLEDPAAYCADSPGMPDPDPAGGLFGAPIEVYAAVARTPKQAPVAPQTPVGVP